MHADYLQIRQAYLAHFGTKGQRWGHRYHQSYETAPTRSGMVGVEHFQRNVKDTIGTNDPNMILASTHTVNRIVDSLSKKDKFDLTLGDDVYMKPEDSPSVVYRSMKKDKAFCDIIQGNDGELYTAVAVSPKAQGKGLGTSVASDAINYMHKNYSGKTLNWGMVANNRASEALAKKVGFKKDPKSYKQYDNFDWIVYRLKL